MNLGPVARAPVKGGAAVAVPPFVSWTPGQLDVSLASVSTPRMTDAFR